MFKDIKNYEGLYGITSCGRVWSYRRKKFLRPRKNTSGYWQVCLCKNGEQKNFLLHRLVAEAYLPNPQNLPEINHIDECKEHNFIRNLEWCDRKYNVVYSLAKPVYCVELDRVFESAHEAARQLGLYATKITNCCKGKQKTTKGYYFNYAEEAI